MARRKTCASAAGDAQGPPGPTTAQGKAFLRAIAADFERNGNKTIRRVRQKRPLDYLKFVGALLPTLFVGNDSPTDDMSDEEFAKVLGEIRKAIAEQERAAQEAEGAAAQEPFHVE